MISAVVAPAAAQSRWRLVWSDEFNAPPNSPPDVSKWTRDRGTNGWGNGELQNYTDSLDNAHHDGAGNLVIRANRAGNGYTSARLKTQHKYAFKYGKVEARILVPFGQGIWPAFWMLGDDFDSAGWPKCGEIDIMENVGKEPSMVHGTIHGPGYSGAAGPSGQFALPEGRRLSDDFHVFTVEWDADLIRWYIDSRLYHTASRANIPPGARWVFDHSFFILLNVAVGGDWPGNPDSSTQFPQEMKIDYVRVYAPAS